MRLGAAIDSAAVRMASCFPVATVESRRGKEASHEDSASRWTRFAHLARSQGVGNVNFPGWTHAILSSQSAKELPSSWIGKTGGRPELDSKHENDLKLIRNLFPITKSLFEYVTSPWILSIEADLAHFINSSLLEIYILSEAAVAISILYVENGGHLWLCLSSVASRSENEHIRSREVIQRRSVKSPVGCRRIRPILKHR